MDAASDEEWGNRITKWERLGFGLLVARDVRWQAFAHLGKGEEVIFQAVPFGRICAEGKRSISFRARRIGRVCEKQFAKRK
jgi:hypothetical protein